jgi:TPR repeat protein
MNYLGLLYANERGVSKNYREARLWYERARESSNKEAADYAMKNLAALDRIEKGTQTLARPAPKFVGKR